MIQPIKNFIQKNAVSLVVLFLLAFLIYLNTLDNAFVSDDIAGMARLQAENPSLLSAFQTKLFANALRVITIFKVFGLSPGFFRLGNIFLHTGNVLLTYTLIYLLANRAKTLALFTAAIFAVHPLASESVAWISAGAYPQFTFFLLLSLTAYILGKKDRKWYLLSLVTFGAAVFTLERAIFFAVVPAMYELAFGNLKKSWRRLIPFLAGGAAVGLYYFSQIGNRLTQLTTENYTPAGTDPLYLKIPIAITEYLKLFVWPMDLTLYHSELAMSTAEFAVRVVILLAFFALIGFAYYKKKYQSLFFWLSVFIISLSPTLMVPWRIAWVVAERYVYFGLIGLSFSAGWLFYQLTQKFKQKEAVLGLFVIVVLLLAGRTFIRNRDWQNPDALWIATGKTSPSDPKTHNNLGDVYGRRGDLKRSAQEFKTAIQLDPDYADAYHNLGNTYQQMGRTDEAIENYQKALKLRPWLWQSHQQLGAIYFEQEKYDLALQQMQKALEIVPQNADLYVNLAVIYLRMEEVEKAQTSLSKALQLDPQNPRAQQLLQQTPSGTPN